MKQVIYKYNLFPTLGVQQILIPEDAEILSADFQGEELVVWASTEPGADLALRRFFLAFTGIGFDVDDVGVLQHIATLQKHNLVWHVFEVEPHASDFMNLGDPERILDGEIAAK